MPENNPLYIVYSGSHKRPTEEVRRTSKAAAKNDVQLLRTICKKRVWFEEV